MRIVVFLVATIRTLVVDYRIGKTDASGDSKICYRELCRY
jgi:hypothetical protein